MKKIAALGLLLTMSSHAMDGDKVRLNCLGTDGTVVALEKKQVIIEVKNLKQNDDLMKKLTADLSLPEDVDLKDISSAFKIKIRAKELNCEELAEKLISCNGDDLEADMDVSLSYRADATFGSLNFSQSYHINNLKLSSSLSASGPIALGAEPATVELNKVAFNIAGDFVINDQTINVSINPTFSTNECQ